MEIDKDYLLHHGILPQYAHLTSMQKAMPVIRTILGLPEYGQLPNTGIGRALQRIVETNRENAVRES